MIRIKKEMFNRIAIIGVGLIGGSIGLAIKKKSLAREVVGVCRHTDSLRRARLIKAIDRGSLNYKDAVKNADLVILAAPIGQIIKIGKKITPYLKEGCLVTDVGSTKFELVRGIERAYARRKIFFVGAHPLAGSEKRGSKFARADLFQGALCILTKTAKTNSSALKAISKFWKGLGSRITVLPARRHDEIVALISHLPHLAAGQLVKAARGSLAFAASGFFDTTRIASSDAEVWTDTFLTNKGFVLEGLGSYIKNLKTIRDLIRKEDKRKLSAEFRKIKTLRDGLQK